MSRAWQPEGRGLDLRLAVCHCWRSPGSPGANLTLRSRPDTLRKHFVPARTLPVHPSTPCQPAYTGRFLVRLAWNGLNWMGYAGKRLRFSRAAGPRLRAAVARSRCGVCCPAALAWKMLRSTRVPTPLHISPAPTEKMERTRKTYPWEVATCPPDRTYNISLCHGAPPLCLN